MSRREGLKAKIAALRAKTTGAGCTEAEALAAAALAAELMTKHGLAEEDLVMTEAVTTDPVTSPTWRNKLSSVIAYCTNTTSFFAPMKERGASVIMFVGREPGPDIAIYLRDVCFRAVEAETEAFQGGRFYRSRRKLSTKRQAAADFREGLCARLSARLLDLFGPTVDDAARADSKAALMKIIGGQGVPVLSRKHNERYSAAVSAGWTAGGSVALHHGVAGSGAAPKRIGGAS